DADVFPRAIETVASVLEPMLPQNCGCVLVVGLGNRGITPDAVGTCAVNHVMVTRHLVEQLPDIFGAMHPVSAIAPGVLGMTGVESGEIIAGVAARVKPDCIIIIDALASRNITRLCNTIQLTDTGIVPGSGVGNARAAINSKTMGVPVIAIGVPTVVDISAIIADIAAEIDTPLPPDIMREYGSQLMVTPKEIDVHITDVGRIIGYAINTVLQPGISIADMDVFLS
ncbi:MAG: GPR endopeptidase, partial [Clostridia bacterium]